MKEIVIECARAGGAVLMSFFGQRHQGRQKESQSSIVTEADLASEKRIMELLRRRFPHHNILAEESGFQQHGSEFTWVIDPLDGTSNFAAGIPWFGVFVALLQGAEPILGAMYLPVDDVLFVAAQGEGVQRNGAALKMSQESDLGQKLFAYGLDSSTDPRETEKELAQAARMINHVRNLRATNCVMDVAYSLEGRFGGFINFNTKIWDIAAPKLLFQEAGGALTYLTGQKIVFDLTPENHQRRYAVLGTSLILQSKVVSILQA